MKEVLDSYQLQEVSVVQYDLLIKRAFKHYELADVYQNLPASVQSDAKIIAATLDRLIGFTEFETVFDKLSISHKEAFNSYNLQHLIVSGELIVVP